MDQRGHELLWIHRRMMDRVAPQASQFSNSVKENGDDLNLHASSASATLLRDQKSNQKKLQPKYSQMKDAAHRPMGNDNAGTEDLEAAVLFDFEGKKNDEQIKDMPPLDSESAPALKTSHGISKRGQSLRGVSNEKEMTKSLHAINNIVHAQPSDRTLHSYNDYNSASEMNFSSRKVQELGNTTTYQNFTPPLLQQPPTSNSTTTVGNIKQGDSMLTSIVAMLILTPCLAAAVAQIIFMWKKRARDRIERELAEVSTNPAGRRMILDEIFKGDSRVSFCSC